MSPPRVLTIAGSDSGGGAGIQADLKTFLSLGTYGLSVLTALTAQNTRGVSAIHPCPPEFVLQQFNSVSQDVEIDAIKIGMLCNEDIVKALAEKMKQWKQQSGPHGGQDCPIVLDPVMVSTSGSLLLSESAIEVLIRDFLPICSVLTPNLPEARQLVKYAAKVLPSTANGIHLADVSDDTELPQMMDAAKKLALLGPDAVLVKGGHAKLKRADIETWLRNLAGSNPPRTVKQSELVRNATSTRYPPRRRKSAKHSSRPIEQGELEGELQQLAGVNGAEVTRAGDVIVIRTDRLPFSAVLEYTSQSPWEQDDRVICDVLYQKVSHGTGHTDGQYTLFIKPLVRSSATHGTGCTLSSALAASLAQGRSILRSTAAAIDYVQRAISCGGIADLGSGPGPLDHSFPFQPRGLDPVRDSTDGGVMEQSTFPLCRSLISNSQSIWESFVQHPFVLGLVDSTLDRNSFLWFMKQDYLFLRHYARVWAQAATSNSNTFQEISILAEMSQAMAQEAELHLRLCEDSFGIDRNELEFRTMESAATLSYTRFVMETGHSGDLLDLLVAVSPCMLGYAEVGLWLEQQTENKEKIDQEYRAWIATYAGKEFQEAVQKVMRLLEDRAQRDPPSLVRLASLQKIWNAACRLEAAMWDEAMDPKKRRPIAEF